MYRVLPRAVQTMIQEKRTRANVQEVRSLLYIFIQTNKQIYIYMCIDI